MKVPHVPMTSPSSTRKQVKAILTKFVSLAGWVAEETVHVDKIAAILAKPVMNPTEARKVAVIVRGPKIPVDRDIKGTTQRNYLMEVLVVVFVREPDPALRWDKLDAIEVEALNALHELEATTDFSATQHELRVSRIAPVSVRQEGNVDPYVGTGISVEIVSFE